MSSRLLIPLACLLAMSCSSPEEVERDVGVSAQASSQTVSAKADTGGRSVEMEDDELSFSYEYPAAAGNIPDLRAELDRRLESARTELEQQASAERKMAEKEGFPYRAHSFGEKWQVVADLPNWLSLSSEIYTYSGGAHGNSGFDSLLWDRKAATIRQPIDLFRSPAALTQAVRQAYCEALDSERAKRRGGPVEDTDDFFSACPAVEELTVLLGSSNGRTFDRIGLLAGPYVAGSYAEGSYETTLPITGSVIDAVKPEYERAFTIKR